jgi:phage tail sheath protein FI
VTFPTLPTAASVDLQAALHNINSEFTKVATVVTVAASAYTAGPFAQVTLQRGYFYRLAVSGVSGVGTIVGKIGG